MEIECTKYTSYGTVDQIPSATEETITLDLPKKTSRKTFLGLCFASLSGFMYSLASVFVKLEHNLYAGEVMLIRLVFSALLSLPLAIYSREPFYHPRTLLILLLCGTSFASSNYFRYEAYEKIPLATANVIVFSTPVIVSILAIPLLKENMTWSIMISLIASTTGLLLILKLPLLFIRGHGNLFEFDKFGIIFAFATLVTNSMNVLSVAMLKKYHFSTLIFQNSWLGSIIGILLVTLSGRATIPDLSTHEPLYSLLQSFSSFLALLFQIVAINMDNVGPVLIFRNVFDIVFAFLFQIFLFKEDADVYSYTGALIVLLSGILITFCKWMKLQSNGSFVVRKLNFLNQKITCNFKNCVK